MFLVVGVCSRRCLCGSSLCIVGVLCLSRCLCSSFVCVGVLVLVTVGSVFGFVFE